MYNYNYSKNDDATAALGCFGVIVLFILLIVISPFIGFCEGWVTGWLIKVTFGDTMIKGLGLLGLNIAKESLPLVCGTLGVVGSFFKSTTINRKKD